MMNPPILFASLCLSHLSKGLKQPSCQDLEMETFVFPVPNMEESIMSMRRDLRRYERSTRVGVELFFRFRTPSAIELLGPLQ